MKRVAFCLMIAGIAIAVLAMIGYMQQDDVFTTVMQIVMQNFLACLISLIAFACLISGILEIAADIGQVLRHPQFDAVMVIISGTLLAILSAIAYNDSPFGGSLALFIGMIASTAAWQISRQRPHRRISLDHLFHRH